MEGFFANGLLIVVSLIFLICVIIGFMRGFIKIVASLAATLIIVLIVTLATPFVSEAIMKLTPIENIVKQKCVEILLPENEAGQTSLSLEELLKLEFTREEQIAMIEKAKLPKFFQDMLLENNNSEVYKSLGVSSFFEYIGSYLAKTISNIIAFLLTLIVVTIVVRVAIYILGIIGNLPVIGGVNRLAGAVVGLGTGLLVVWILFIVITLMYDTELGQSCFKNIEQSKFLTFLYEKNLLLDLITKVQG